jgi:multidrug resistance efflux pump
MDNLSLNVVIGAALKASVDNTIAAVPKKLAKIGDAISALDRRNQKLKFLEGAEVDLEKSRAKLAAVSAELLRVKAAMRSAKGDELDTLSKKSAALERRQATLATGVEHARESVKKSSEAYKEAHTAVDQHAVKLGKWGSPWMPHEESKQNYRKRSSGTVWQRKSSTRQEPDSSMPSPSALA